MVQHVPERPRRVGNSGATRVRGQARSILRPSGPPTMPISVRATGDRVSEWHTRAVIDFTLRLGEAMLVTGASVADTTAAVLRVCRAYGLTSVHTDITYTSVTISFHRGVHRDPITTMRIVTRFGIDYSRLEALHALVREICADPEDPGDVEDNLHELEFILEQPNAYRRGVVALAYAGMGGAVAAQMGGHLALILLIAVTALGIHQAQTKIAHLGVSAFFGQVVGGAIAGAVAAVVMSARRHFLGVEWLQDVRPSIIVASSIVVLLAGMSVVTAAQDTLDGFYVTASARTYEVVLMTTGIVAGILASLGLARHLDVTMPVIPNDLHANLPMQVVASALVAAFFAISAFCGPVTISLSFVVGGFSFALFSVLKDSFGWNQAICAGTAAFLVGCLAPRTARIFHVPSVALTTAGIMPLLPGLAVYKGIMYFVHEHSGGSTLLTLLNAGIIAMALAVGSSLGTLLGRQLTAGANSTTAKVLGRTVASTHTE